MGTIMDGTYDVLRFLKVDSKGPRGGGLAPPSRPPLRVE